MNLQTRPVNNIVVQAIMQELYGDMAKSWTATEMLLRVQAINIVELSEHPEYAEPLILWLMLENKAMVRGGDFTIGDNGFFIF